MSLTAFKTILTLGAATFSFLLMGCSNGVSERGTPALFNTKSEAEKAAKDFNCTGAHKMGEKWMPCESHKDHKENKKQSSHGLHNH